MAKKKELRENLRQRVVHAHVKERVTRPFQSSMMSLWRQSRASSTSTRSSTLLKTSAGVAGSVRCPPKLGRKICREVNNNPWTTAKAVNEMLDQAGMKVSRSTIERVLHRGGLHGRGPGKAWKTCRGSPGFC